MSRALRALLGARAVVVVGITAYLTPAVSSITRVVLGLLAVVTFWYVWRWPQLEQRLAAAEARAGRPDPLPAAPERPRLFDLAVGFVTNFFDTLGIGNFAPTTAALKLTRRIPDEDIPGTLNVGHAFPVLTEALILIAAIAVDPRLLIAMIVASILMTLGIGLYAPCLIMLSLLGLNPRAVFPIMMGSCAFLMPIGGMRFVRRARTGRRGALIGSR